ncbi:MAG: hypothetical protein JNM53_09750 [Gemmatimonadetes bacterium]|nr:hypothetical protein [Gemmatimonadota bacterium]
MPIQVPAPVLRAVSLGWLAFALAGCDTGSSEPDPVVYFELDAPLCSSVIPVTFQVDGSGVGADTFRVNLPPDHLRSRAFVVVAGDHVLGAAVPGGFVWPDTAVHLTPGDTLVRLLPFYCS